MARSGSAFEYGYVNRFDGGVNSTTSPLRIADNEMRVAHNAVLTNIGAVQKRAGHAKYSTALGSISGTILFLGEVTNPLGGNVTVTLTVEGETPVVVVVALAYEDSRYDVAEKVADGVDAETGWSAVQSYAGTIITNDSGDTFTVGFSAGTTGISFITQDSDSYSISRIHRLYVPGFKQTIVAARRRLADTVEIYRYTPSGGWVEITGTDITRSGNVRFTDYMGNLYLYDGDVFQYYRGSGTVRADVVYADDSREVKPRLMAVSDDRLFVVDSRYLDQIFYSEYGSSPLEMDIKTDNWLPLPERTNDQSGITAMISFSPNDELLVTAENQVYALLGVGPLDYQFIKVSSNAGCVGPDAICATPYGQVVMAGVNNIFLFEGGTITSIATNKIIDKLRGLNLRQAKAWYSPKIDSVVISTYKECFVWNCATRGWTTWDSLEVAHAALFGSAVDGGTVVFCKGDPYLYEMGIGRDDDGEDFDMVVETKAFDFEVFAEEKQLRSVKVATDTFSLAPCSVEIICDDGVYELLQNVEIKKKVTLWSSTTAKVGQSNVRYVGSTLSFGALSADTQSRGNTLAVRVTSRGDSPLTIYGIALELAQQKRRREEP
jgi:hypothetical protein